MRAAASASARGASYDQDVADLALDDVAMPTMQQAVRALFEARRSAAARATRRQPSVGLTHLAPPPQSAARGGDGGAGARAATVRLAAARALAPAALLTSRLATRTLALSLRRFLRARRPKPARRRWR
jgi:hypothetical protein